MNQSDANPRWALLVGTLLAWLLAVTLSASLEAKPVTIMPLGDSLTEGGTRFVSYRMPLWELLVGHGYVVEFVGFRSSAERIGPLQNEGYSGRPVEFLAERIAEIYRANPADIVLLHAGHNHSVEEKPIDGILRSTRRIIDTVREINPRVIVLLAQPILTGKLPKYAYVPELNRELAKLAEADRLTAAGRGFHPVVLVNQAADFDWRTDAIDDHVHANPVGAKKIARRWFAALQQVLPAPESPVPEPQRFTYKRVGNVELTLDVFRPKSSRPAAPAVVYFFGGGWRLGSPIQFYRECARLAKRGIVGISADYRIDTTGPSTPFDSVADAKSAIRWVRAHAAELGIDPTRVAAAGASAGGHLAAAAAWVPGFDDPADDRSVSCRPDALVLLYPVLDTGANGYRVPLLGDGAPEISPLEHVAAPAPPTLVLVGDRDPVLPVKTAQLFQSRAAAAGGRCELHVYPGAEHPIWLYRGGENEVSRDIDAKVDAFLAEIGWLQPTSVSNKSMATKRHKKPQKS